MVLVICSTQYDIPYISGPVKFKLWYIEKNNAFERWSERFGYYRVGNGLINDAPYYVSEGNQQYSLWKDNDGNWCSGFSSEANQADWSCAMKSHSKDICSSDWFYGDENNKWQSALNGVVIQCPSGTSDQKSTLD